MIYEDKSGLLWRTYGTARVQVEHSFQRVLLLVNDKTGAERKVTQSQLEVDYKPIFTKGDEI